MTTRCCAPREALAWRDDVMGFAADGADAALARWRGRACWIIPSRRIRNRRPGRAGRSRGLGARHHHGAKAVRRDSNGGRRATSISFPATLGSFDELLLLLHRFPLKMTAAASDVRPDVPAAGGRAPYRGLGAGGDAGGRYFRGRLLPFQTEGVAFLCAVRKGLLADDMGLGKTVQAFGFLDRIGAWPAAIVVQSACAAALGKEDHRIHAGRELADDHRRGPAGHLAQRRQALDSTPAADVYIVHYLVLHAWSEFLIERGVKTVIFDECQELRHPEHPQA
jgi:hypothetical protein